MPLSCAAAKAALHRLQSLEAEFNETLSAAATAKDEESANKAIAKAKDLKQTIERAIAALREQLPPRLERELNLREQYEEQINILRLNNLLERLPSGKEGFRVKDKEYPLPTYEAIVGKIRERRELYQQKAEQGFTQFQLVPFGLPLKRFTDAHRSALERHRAAGQLFRARSIFQSRDEPQMRGVGTEGFSARGGSAYCRE